MIELLEKIDTKLFLFFNRNHSPFMDDVMRLVTHKFTWIPLYILLLFLVFRKVRSGTWMVMLSVAILIVLSDQISVHLFKEVFERYRPCHNLLLKGQVHVLDGNCGGQFGFVSSHAANTFALFTFLSFLFRNRWFFLLMYVWASLVSYSRIYAGVHYPFDILGGMMLGMVLGFIVYAFYRHYSRKAESLKVES